MVSEPKQAAVSASVRYGEVGVPTNGRFTTPEEIQEAIAPVIPDQSVSVDVSRSFLLEEAEEAIREEAKTINADIIVLGKSQKATWRRVLDRVVGTAPDVGPFLCESTTAEIIVVE